MQVDDPDLLGKFRAPRSGHSIIIPHKGESPLVCQRCGGHTFDLHVRQSLDGTVSISSVSCPRCLKPRKVEAGRIQALARFRNTK